MYPRSPLFLLAGLLLAHTSAGAAMAAVPDFVSLQGRLTQGGDAPIEGPVSLIVSLYVGQTDDTPVYVEQIEPVPLSAGRFAVTFGTDPLPGQPPLKEVLEAHPELWLGFRIDGGDEMPRQRLAAVPYALRAARAAVADTVDITCDVGNLLVHGAGGWGCAAALDASQVGFSWAAGATPGGAATDLECSGCVGPADLAPGVINASHVQDGGISADDVAFSYAGADTKGGAAKDLECDGCIDGSEIASGVALSGTIQVDELRLEDASGDGARWSMVELPATGDLVLGLGGGVLRLIGGGGVDVTGGVAVGGSQVIDPTGAWVGPAPWAAATTPGGPAADVDCVGCVEASAIPAGAITAGHIQDGSVAAADVAFSWAGGVAPGGDASGLACSGCVDSSELAPSLALAGDTTVGGSLEACHDNASGCFLAVAGDLKATGDAAVEGTLSVGATTGNARVVIGGSSPTEDLLRAEVGGVTRLRVRGDGFMAIGGQGPNAALDVTAGNQIQVQAAKPELILDDTQAGGRQYRLHSGRNEPGTLGIYDWSKGADVLSIDGTGEVAVPGTLAVGDSMSFHDGQAFAFRVANLDAEPGTCTEALQGMLYFDVPARTFMGCDGQDWVPLNGEAAAPAGTESNPGSSCSSLRSEGVTASGLYWIDPDGAGGTAAFQAWCDMVTDDRGWTLVGKVNTADVYNQPEPHDWFAQLLNPDAMLNADMVKNDGLASLDADRFTAIVGTGAIARFELIAEDDYNQRATWYKQVASADSFKKWFQTDPAPSLTCTDLALTQNCSTSVVGVVGDVTQLQGMTLAHYGYNGGVLHMRLDGDGGPQYTAVCSSTGNNDNNAWHDDGLDGHWGNGLNVWLSTAEQPLPASPKASCEELRDAGETANNLYWIDPDGPGGNGAFQVWCDMTRDGGGWTLVAKVNTADVYDQPEPHDWFAQTLNAGSMANDTMVKNAGLASLGASRFTALIDTNTLSRFELIAEDDYNQRAFWFKKVASTTSFTNWFQTDPTPSLTCTNTALTQNCSASIVGRSGDTTQLQGMTLAHYGYNGGVLHMRLDGDGGPQYTAVCSSTGNNDNNAWHDDGLDGHWGNGLNVWIR